VRSPLLVYTFVIGLLLTTYLFVEYEGGLLSPDVLARPSWSYPVLLTLFALFMFGLMTAMTRVVGVATMVTTLYVLARFAALGFDRAVLDYSGVIPYPLFVPAIVFDVALLFLWSRGGRQATVVIVGAAGLLGAVTIALATPLFWALLDIAPALNVKPWCTYWPGALFVGVGAALGG
jgi:hypothetical protein